MILALGGINRTVYGVRSIPSPPQLFSLFDAGRLTRDQLHAALDLHARELLVEMVIDQTHPVLATIERKLSQQAAATLIRRHGEPEMREILRALAEAPDFPPARLLWNVGHTDVPLHCFLRTRHEPVFRILRVDVTRLTAAIAVEHGAMRAKSLAREEFCLRRGRSGGLVIESRRIVSR